jgi:PKD repeat protein
MKHKQFVLIFSFLVLFAFIGFVQAAQIEKGPYLIYEGDNTGMTALWQLDATDSCTLEWGTDTSYSDGSVQTAEYGSDHQHKYSITGLTPGTMYYYRVSFSSSSYTGSFRAAPALSAENLKFFAYGDTRTYPSDQNVVAGQMINTYSADPAFQTVILHVGDWINSDTESYWTNEFFPRSYANLVEMQANLPIQGCIGNHEGSGAVYEKYYPYPYVTTSDFYWSFDYGPIHVAVVDQYTSYSTGSTQYNWLENDLASTSKKWIFLVFHEPGWSAGGHSNEVPVQDYIQPLCTQYGVDIVFCGHNHYYARCEVDGVQHVTTGGGGAPLYSANNGYPYVVVTAEVNHHCEIDIQGSDLYFTARRENGTIIDSFTLIDTSGPVTPVANFTANDTTVYEGDTVNFTDQSTNTPTSWSWTFDGGTPSSSTVQNPGVTYNTAGTYTVSLTATNAAGSDTMTKVDYITVSVLQPPVADFTASATTVTEGDTVNFTDLSTNDPTSWSWTFNGGTPSSSTVQNPGVTYNTAGTYTVELTAANTGGSDTETKVDYITVNPIPAPVADFTASATTVFEGETVNFTDQSTNNPTSWSWTFNGGTPASSTAQNPGVTYNTAGTYTVELTAANTGGSDTETKVDYITVNTAPEIYVFDITQTPKIAGKNYESTAVVTIMDTASAPVANATVTITWSGVVSGSASGVTAADGTVSFKSSKVKSTGPFIITVNNVTHATLIYNPALNVETTDTATF